MKKKRIGFFVVFYILCFIIIGLLFYCLRFDSRADLVADVKDKLGITGISSDTLDDAVSKAGDKISELTDKAQEKAVETAVESKINEAEESASSADGILSSTADIGLYDKDGAGKNYAFTYNGEIFDAYYNGESWTIYNSYKITVLSDMTIICQALSDVHPILGRDRQSYRTADDMAYEWMQHNIAYEYLPADSHWHDKARDVNLDPDDQGRSIEELYKDRTGEDLGFSKIWQKLKEYY